MKIITAPDAFHFQNPAYGRGLQVFTSFISDQSKFIFLETHLERLLRGANFLFPQEKWNEKQSEIKDFMLGQFKASTYFRLSIFESTLVLNTAIHSPRNEKLTLTNAQCERSPTLAPSFLKIASYLTADLEIKNAALNLFDDVVFFDKNKNVCEASTSNLFIVMDGAQILTPPLSSMVLEGVTRTKLMEFLKKNNYHIQEANISLQDLDRCSEVWLTNSVSGIRFAENYNNNKKQNQLYRKVCLEFGRFGERYE